MLVTQVRQRLERKKKAASARPPGGDKRYVILDTFMKRQQFRGDSLIEVLHKAQELFGFLDDPLLLYIARALHLPPSRVYGVATFYHYFTLKPQGEHTCVVCTGTACHINGAGEILTAIKAAMALKPRETTPDGKLSLLTARCLGVCSLAPAAIVDGVVEGRVVADEFVTRLEML